MISKGIKFYDFFYVLVRNVLELERNFGIYFYFYEEYVILFVVLYVKCYGW